jgi:hypothetical protein
VELTSPVLPYVLGSLAAVVLAVIIVAWPRLARFGVWPVVLRIVSLCLLQTLVLGLIFVIVNQAGEFYASWSDLFGSVNGGAGVVAASGSPAQHLRPLVVTGSTIVRVPGRRNAAGTLQSVRFNGPLSGLTVTGHVYLPVGYQQRSARQYPVLMEISSAASDSNSPYAPYRLAQSAALQIAARRMPLMIVVMLPAALSPNDQACLNIPPVFGKGGRSATAPVLAETFFAQDVPGVLEAGYGASSKPGGWALLGDRAGGYCALQLALDNPYVFSIAAAPRGDYSRPPGMGSTLSSPAFRQQDDLVWLLAHTPMQPVSVLLAGPGQLSGPGLAQPFLTLAQRPMRVSTTQLGTGSWPLANVLDWIGAAVASNARQG